MGRQTVNKKFIKTDNDYHYSASESLRLVFRYKGMASWNNSVSLGDKKNGYDEHNSVA